MLHEAVMSGFCEEGAAFASASAIAPNTMSLENIEQDSSLGADCEDWVVWLPLVSYIARRHL